MTERILTGETAVSKLITDVAGAETAGTSGNPRSVHEARRAVEASRARIAATLDELEDRLVEKKEMIQRKADVVRPVREAIRKTPLIAIGVAVAAGLLLGAMGGGDGDDDEDESGFDKRERKALDEWKRRRHKLLMDEAEDASDDLFEEETREPGPFGRLLRTVGHEVGGVAVGIIAAELAERFYKPVSGNIRDASRGVRETSLDDDFDPEYADDDVAYDDVGGYAEDSGDDMEYGDDVEYRG
jgi:ElaB/YqjD/DUF883 family membrane-anchored ribosome-binding protein